LNQNVPRLTSTQALLKGPFGTLPDFLIIGAQKCGTTALYDTLVQHPAVLPAYQKEVHYFDRYYNKGLLWYRANMPTRAARRAAKKAGVHPIAGEAAPSYIYHPLAPGRVKKLVPHARLIVLLRNPVNRAYSHYQKERDREDESLTFEEAIDREAQRVEPGLDKVLSGKHSHSWWHYSYLARGRYAEQLERWFALFPREQFLILRSEDYAANTLQIVDQSCRFLGIAEGQITTFPRSNKSGYEKPLAPETRQKLVDYFRPHNQRLYEMIGRDMEWD
jgi:hypothetical protein